MAEELPILLFASGVELEAWLEDGQATSKGIWLKIAKKESGVKSVSYMEALELALCFGWIDSQKRGFDEKHFLQRFTPRRPRGRWSRNNRKKAEELISSGAMRTAGMAEVQAAKADGRWEAAYEGQKNAKVPIDLARELDRNTAAREFFSSLDSSNRYAIIYRLNEANNPRLGSAGCTSSSACLREARRFTSSPLSLPTLARWTSHCSRGPSPRPVDPATGLPRYGAGSPAGRAPMRR